MISKIENICCIGAGYVGGPTMSVIADKCPHIQVNVVDINQERIDNWNNNDLSQLPIYEPGLKELVKRCRGKNLHFSNNLEDNISKADMIFISVNTPVKTKGIGAGMASDLKWVEASARQIKEFAIGETIIVEKSTLPVKTAKTIKSILENDPSFSEEKIFHVLSNPEFLAEGSAIKDLEFPDRVLIGGENKKAIELLINIYLNWVERSKIITTNLWSSELSKLVSNAFLAQRVSSINSISALCESTGANIHEVALAVGTDKRIGNEFLKPGPGFGGSCFKKDILNLVYLCDFYGLEEVSSYWQKVIDMNNWQQKRISNLVVQKLFGSIENKKIGILGFAFKANTNDIRESPAINISRDLMEEGAFIKIYDPKVSVEQIKQELLRPLNKKYYENTNWKFLGNIYDACDETDAIIILTDWDEFKNIDWQEIAPRMRKPAWIFDTRSIITSNKNIRGINIWRTGID